MNTLSLDEIHAHALDDYPSEACGLLVASDHGDVYVRCRNRSRTPSEHFDMDPEDYAAAEDTGEVLAVIHSHPDATAEPSEADRVLCEASGLPWLIVSVMRDGDEPPSVRGSATLEPCGYEAPLEGRTFFHGVLDCWALVRDWYARELGVTLPNPERVDEWWNDGKSDMYSDAAMKGAGFVAVSEKELQRGDLILMQIRSRNVVPNHVGIYVGDGLMLHHLYNRLSKRDVYGGYWRENTRSFWRWNHAAP